MPIKPGKNETQSDWMSRCVPDMMGQDGGTKRPKEQAVAACLQMWRDAKGGKKPSKDYAEVQRIIALWCKLLEKQTDVPEPEDGESRADFMERCAEELSDDLSDDEIEQACELAWQDWQSESVRADGIVVKSHITEGTGMAFVLSDETPDRYGDVISADGWRLDTFRRNPVALFSHMPTFIVGKWDNVRVEGKALRGDLTMAPEGTSDRIDELRRLIAAGMLRAVSVGFKDLESEPLDKEAKDPFGFGPKRFKRQELVECSLVAIPANPNALHVAKSLNISSQTQALVFGEDAKENGKRKSSSAAGKHATRQLDDVTGKDAAHTRNRRGTAMSGLSQRISDRQASIKEMKDRLDALLQNVDDSNVSDKDYEAIHDFNERIARETKTLNVLLESERQLGETVSNGNGTGTAVAVREAEHVNGKGNGVDEKERERRKQYFQASSGKKDLQPLDYVVRAGIATFLGKLFGRSPDEICKNYPPYSDDRTRAIVDWNIRGAVNPAMTTVTGWAAELVIQINADYLGLLMPSSVYPRLAARGTQLQFGRAGRIAVPTRSATPTIAGSFVGEGMPIPVRQGAFTAQVLTPKKLAVITEYTKEIDEHSIPAIEGLLREAIQEDTAVAVDSVLLDANAATVVRPPGLLNGVTPITATAGGGFAAIVGDLKALIGALTTATKGNLRSPTWLMNPAELNSASFIVFPNGEWAFREEVQGGTLNSYPIIDSGTVPLKTVVLVDAADFVTVGGEGPRFDISDSAVVHEEDTAPAAIVGGVAPGTPANPVRSFWQTDTLGLRMIQRLNWTMRRSGMVAAVQSVTW